jgi:NAD-dependent SIR2 family protein deacetylase
MAIRHNAGNHRRQYGNFMDSFTAHKKYNPFTDGIVAEQTYGIRFPYTNWEGKSVYLKLHGSIDWFSCSNSGCRAHGELFVVEDPMKEYFCSDCYEHLYNVLIPPVLNKQLKEFPIIRKIWNTALHEMREAKHLVIWGYSLPPTDFYSSWLLRQARSNISTLTLINPSVIRKNQRLNNSYINRFVELFRKSKLKTDIRLYESMSDYVRSQDVYSKYPSLAKS